jgi:hypothetical protein
MQFLIRLLVRSRLAAAVFTGVFALAFGALGFHSWRQLRAYPSAPLPITLVEAVQTDQDRWVTITGARPDCVNALSEGSDGLTVPLIGADDPGAILIVNFPSGEECSDQARQVTGVLGPMNTRRRASLARAGFRLPDSTRVLYLCTSCGPGNDRLGVILGSVLAGISVCLFAFTEVLRRRGAPSWA